MSLPERVILGIDPGTNLMGYGAVLCQGKKIELLALGVVDLKKFGDHYLKLGHIFERTLGLVESFKPDEMAIEAPFFGKNVQSMLKLGRAQGVAMAAALYRSVPIIEYSPKKIKMAITGNGNAAKEQVAAMLAQLLKIEDLPKQLDATDGLAAAVCHAFQGQVPASAVGKKSSGWDSFIKSNPDRVL